MFNYIAEITSNIIKVRQHKSLSLNIKCEKWRERATLRTITDIAPIAPHHARFERGISLASKLFFKCLQTHQTKISAKL